MFDTSVDAAARKFCIDRLCGNSVFVSLPTGFGKSLIYQLCAKALVSLRPSDIGFHPFILMVSPLISLMQDQVASLRSKGLKLFFSVHRT